MSNIRYGPRSKESIRNRELEATGRETWSDSLEAVYETDPDVIAAVLPPPLKPGPEPLVRLNISMVTMPGDLIFGAGWFGVQACHDDVLGEYPLLMPMTTEQATVGGRETFGEPKKIAEIKAEEIFAEHGLLDTQREDLEDESQFLFTDVAEEIDEEDEDMGLSDEMKDVYS